jgi:hypothetical protein
MLHAVLAAATKMPAFAAGVSRVPVTATLNPQPADC